MKNLIDENYLEALVVLWSGIKKLSACLYRTIVNSFKDAGIFIWKHPIFTLILVAIFGFMAYTAMTSRAERNTYAKTNYQLEQSKDSLEIMLGK